MPAILTGIAWYVRAEWPLLLGISTDGDSLERTYEEWHVIAERAYARLQEEGLAVEKVEVRVVELLAWCAEQGRPVDESARAAFVSDKLRRRDELAVAPLVPPPQDE